MPRKGDTSRRKSGSEDGKSTQQSHVRDEEPAPKMTETVMDLPERPPPFEFITLTDRPATHKSDFSYLIRSHAMQAVVHERRNPESKNRKSASQTAAETEIKTSKELSGKFKLNTWKKKKRRKKGTAAQESESGDKVSGDDGDDVASEIQTVISPSLRAYGELPISTSSRRTQQLLYHYNTGFITNAFAINYDDTWKPFSTTDPALLHATLCLVAQHEDLVRGVEDSSENLFHKGEVMRLMNSRLLDGKYKVTDADVTSVALLVILEAINGSFEAATAHKIGLSKMISFYGGLLSFEQNPVVVRVLSWSDIAYSTRFGAPPEYPYLATHLDMSSEFFPRTRHFPLDDQASHLMHTLRQISYMVSLPTITPYQKHAATSTATNTEYLILSTTTPLIPGSSPQTILSQAFTLAALLYLHLTFRLLPSFPHPSRLHLRLIPQILALISSLPFAQYSTSESRDLLLWIVFVCSAASGSGYPRHRKKATDIETKMDMGHGEEIGVNAQDFVVLMREVHPEILGQSKAQVRARLRSVVWREGVCDTLHDGIWMVVESMRAGNVARV
ncbi:hypothetical protein N431DRAFT_368979 [Stipitochalara longipes BDJ]|nr:hypothetical protein N431DRAFT_368979 [Stipitochalara longipes BDJ]